MKEATIEDRVDRLEDLFGRFLTEMQVFTRQADERHKAADLRMTRIEENALTFRNEMRAFKDEMLAFKNEMRDFRREMNKKWGDLSNKLGTIIEDILAPNLPRLALEYFGFGSVEEFSIRHSRRSPGDRSKVGEFDAIVIGETAVILGEAKSTPSLEYADEFASKARTFFDYFPEHQSKRLILIFGSWSIPESIVTRLTGQGIYAMQMGNDTMDLVNAGTLDSGAL
ncbi:MAG: hypothetical protein K9N62_06520 [Verrucomicrobia bacterium]|nr:hypothetical protein [Verrucomicrobiota bacterium]